VVWSWPGFERNTLKSTHNADMHQTPSHYDFYCQPTQLFTTRLGGYLAFKLSEKNFHSKNARNICWKHSQLKTCVRQKNIIFNHTFKSFYFHLHRSFKCGGWRFGYIPPIHPIEIHFPPLTFSRTFKLNPPSAPKL